MIHQKLREHALTSAHCAIEKTERATIVLRALDALDQPRTETVSDIVNSAIRNLEQALKFLRESNHMIGMDKEGE